MTSLWFIIVSMTIGSPTPLSPKANASGNRNITSTALKAGRAIGTAWIASVERASRLAALQIHYGCQLELGVGSVTDEQTAAAEVVKDAIGPTGILSTTRRVREVGIGECWRSRKEVRRVAEHRLETARKGLRRERVESNRLEMEVSWRLPREEYMKWKEKAALRSKKVFSKEMHKGDLRRQHHQA